MLKDYFKISITNLAICDETISNIDLEGDFLEKMEGLKELIIWSENIFDLPNLSSTTRKVYATSGLSTNLKNRASFRISKNNESDDLIKYNIFFRFRD